MALSAVKYQMSSSGKLKVVPRHIAKVTLIKVDVQNTDNGTRLVFLVSNIFFYLRDLEVVKDAVRQHEAYQHLVVE